MPGTVIPAVRMGRDSGMTLSRQAVAARRWGRPNDPWTGPTLTVVENSYSVPPLELAVAGLTMRPNPGRGNRCDQVDVRRACGCLSSSFSVSQWLPGAATAASERWWR